MKKTVVNCRVYIDRKPTSEYVCQRCHCTVSDLREYCYPDGSTAQLCSSCTEDADDMYYSNPTGRVKRLKPYKDSWMIYADYLHRESVFAVDAGLYDLPKSIFMDKRELKRAINAELKGFPNLLEDICS